LYGREIFHSKEKIEMGCLRTRQGKIFLSKGEAATGGRRKFAS